MTKFIASFLILFAVVSAQASVYKIEANLRSVELNKNSSHFETLGEWFASAKSPELYLLKKAWSGRCFTPNSPSTPQNAVYLLKASDGVSVQQLILTYPGKPADYFDGKTTEEVLAMPRANEWWRPAGTWNSAIVAEQGNDTIYTKQYENYLVTEFVTLELDPSGPIAGPGTPVTSVRCYFFKATGK